MLTRMQIGFMAAASVLATLLFAQHGGAGAAKAGETTSAPVAAGNGSFPEVSEVLRGRQFATRFEREVFFLRRVRESYPAYWSPLLGANITVNDYVQAPAKLLRFVQALEAATAGTDDRAASTNLAAITSDPVFYANTNAYRPEVLRAAASALIQIGTSGRRALADSFNEHHYRIDPESLEEIAEVVGKSGVSDSRLAAALVATAFTFTATNGGFYPRCTEQAVRNLLRLPEGAAVSAAHLNAKEVLDDPGRFQAVVHGLAAARAVLLATNLVALEREVAAKLSSLTNSPGPYRDELYDLHLRIGQAVSQLQPRHGKLAPGRFHRESAGATSFLLCNCSMLSSLRIILSSRFLTMNGNQIHASATSTATTTSSA
jgi:hypothetical protein